MCLFSGPVEAVADTRIFARPTACLPNADQPKWFRGKHND